MKRLEQNKKLISTALAAGAEPRQRGKQTILPTGQRRDTLDVRPVLVSEATKRNSSYIVLANNLGIVTPSGEFYYEQSGQKRPDESGLSSQALIHKGGSDFIQAPNGKQRLIRTLQPNGRTVLTALGKTYFKDKVSEYVVHIPVIISGTRANGNSYTRTSSIPVDQLGLGQIMSSQGLSPAERVAEVKKKVLAGILGAGGVVGANGRQTLMEISGEAFQLQRDGQWLISELSTSVGTGGGVTTEARIMERLGGLRNAAVHLPYPDHILEEAFVEHGDRLCIPRQLGILLNRSLDEMCESFDDLLGGPAWREEGLCAKTLKKWCALRGHPFFFISGAKLILMHEPPVKRGRALAGVAFDGHFYMYKSARCVANWHLRDAPSEKVMVQQECHHSPLAMADWKPWAGVVEAGHFFTPCLTATRRQLLESGISPKVSLRGCAEIGALTIQVGRKVCVIRERIADRTRIEAWLERLPRDIAWCGERLPGLAQKVFFELLRAERRTPNAAQKAQLLTSQDGRCVDCGGLFDGDVEWDHVVPLQQTVSGAPQIFRALCASCHLDKTLAEGSQARTLTSTFSKNVWDAYVSSARPPPLVWRVHDQGEGQLFELDVRRCRRSALAHSAHDFPVFSPYDSIRRSVPGELCDFTFVALKPGRRNAVSLLPWVGPMWYCRVACEHLLHYGICTWDDCLWSLQATSHIPKECLLEPLRIMEEAWGDARDLAKFSVNALVGLWATTNLHTYSVVTSSSPCDAEGSVLKRIVEFGEGETTHDFIRATRVLQNCSMRPIHDQIMHTEATRMAQLAFVLRALGVPRRDIADIKTDAITLVCTKKRRTEMAAVATTTFAELPGLRRKYTNCAGQAFLDEGVTPAACHSEDLVFRYSEETKPLQGIYKEPHRECEPPTELQPWRDLTQEAAVAAVMRGAGLLLLGAPGVGKTWLLRELIVQLREAGKHVDCIAKTHVATKNVGCDAVTADHWVRKHVRAGGFSCHVLVVEELSQIDAQIWADLALVSMKGTQLICCGDFGQFQAVAESWAGCPVREGALQSSDMLLEMCGGNRLTLTENRRSDARLFDFYTGLGSGTPAARPIREALSEARALFPKTKQIPDVTLTMSHKRRVILNRMHNQWHKPDGALYIRAPPATRAGNQPQSMWVWSGLRVIGAGGKCLKGLFYTVRGVTEDQVILEGLTLSHPEAVRSLRLAYALTFASCQGLTLPGRVRLETESPHMTIRHLYVGISRATAAGLVEVV